jgi:hypothetical protein
MTKKGGTQTPLPRNIRSFTAALSHSMTALRVSRHGIREIIRQEAKAVLDSSIPREPERRRVAMAGDIANACAAQLRGIALRVARGAVKDTPNA